MIGSLATHYILHFVNVVYFEQSFNLSSLLDCAYFSVNCYLLFKKSSTKDTEQILLMPDRSDIYKTPRTCRLKPPVKVQTVPTWYCNAFAN